MIKVINQRQEEGDLFHYAHFLCDCLFPEIVNDLYLYPKVVRKKTLQQTIGNFKNIYEEVMKNKNEEVEPSQFHRLKCNLVTYRNKEEYSKLDYYKFRNYIFTIYGIVPEKHKWPEVLLIKRKGRISLIDDETLGKENRNVTTGKERREIKDIDLLDHWMNQKYGICYTSLFLEDCDFKTQVQYFYHAKLIVCAHGAAMSNLLFCRENECTIIEVVCNTKWKFFDTITNILGIKHIKCNDNTLSSIQNMLCAI